MLQQQHKVSLCNIVLGISALLNCHQEEHATVASSVPEPTNTNCTVNKIPLTFQVFYNFLSYPHLSETKINEILGTLVCQKKVDGG